MLIRSIRAENFMRFSRLALENLPTEGILGIEGPNESGKTTVGEVLLFAFFGKTRMLVDSPVLSLIRWGADSMNVEVEFSLEPAEGPPREHGVEQGAAPKRAETFLIFRQVDRYGTNYVKVVDLPDRREVASGNIQVAEFVARRVGFDAGEFQQSFYHDQYEIRKVQTAQVAFFESATGVKQIHDAIDVLRREVEPLEREFAYYQKEIARNRSQVEKYNRNVAKLPELTGRRSRLEEALEDSRRKTAELKSLAEGFRVEASRLGETSSRLEKLMEASVDDLARGVDDITAKLDQPSGRGETLFTDEPLRGHAVAIRSGLDRLGALGRDVVALLGRIGDRQKDLSSSREDTVARIRDLEERAMADRRKARRRLLEAIPPLVAGAALVFWLVDYVVKTMARGRVDFLAEYRIAESLPGWIRDHMPLWIGFLAGVLLFLLFSRLVGFLRHSRSGRLLLKERERTWVESERLGREATALSRLTEIRGFRDVPRLVGESESSGDAEVQEASGRLRESHGALLEPDRMLELRSGVVGSHQSLRALVAAEAQKVDRQIQEQEAARKKLQGEYSRAESELHECESQVAKKEALEEKNRELEASAAAIRAEIDIRLLAASLLEETASAVRAKVGPTLTRFVKRALPKLTLDRYRDVRVESDLEIKVYSSEKNDFLSIHELSGGTNEALSLALRLAVSQALVSARMRQAQFVLLDEPFKMMDSERSLETLRILRTLSPDLRQFLLIQPQFSDKEREQFSCRILTSRDVTRLEVACS